MTMRRFVLVLCCLPACFAPGDALPGDGSSSDGSTTAPASASTDPGTMSGGSGGGTETSAAPGEESTTAAPESSDDSSSSGEASSSEASSSDASSSDASTGAIDPCGLELESFDADPGWVSSGLPDGGNVYGWSAPTSHAGGGLGEVGGTFQRSLGDSYYADAVGVLDATRCIAATGLLAVTRQDADYNDGAWIGHFAVDADALVGFVVYEHVEGVRIFVNAGGLHELAFEVPDPDVPRAWSYAYDPIAATITLDLEGFGSVSHDLTPEEVEPIADLDAFGLRNAPSSEPEIAPGLLELWIDDVDYTR
jgi:hypothetical protein